MNAENPCIHFTERQNNIAGAFRHFLQKKNPKQKTLGG